MMNSDMNSLRSREAAGRLLADRELADDGARLHLAYLTFFVRPPDPPEVSRALAFLRGDRMTGEAVGEEDAWAALCQTFFASNEFVHLN
jgi:hypothetical protein